MERQESSVFQWGASAISIVAGVWTVYHLIWSISTMHQNIKDDYWGQGLLVLFIVAVILAFGRYFQERARLTASTSQDEFPEPAIAKFYLGSSGAAALWFIVRMNVGAQWFLAGWEKMRSPVWGTSGTALKGFVAGALSKTTGANPSVQGWYANFLRHFVQPNAGLFSFLVTWGELAVGVGVLVGALVGIAAGFGVLMNLNYLLAGTVSINPVLGTFGLFLCFAWRVAGYYGVDRFLLPALGLPWKPGKLFGGASVRSTANPPLHATS